MGNLGRVLGCMCFQGKFRAPMDSNTDLSGKRYVVTGPTLGGIGYYTALVLVQAGAHVTVVGRNKERTEAAVKSIESESGNKKGRISFVLADISDIESVREACQQHLTDTYDCVIANAGMQTQKFRQTKQGVELTFATCILGHLLMIESIKSKRVVWTTGEIYVMAHGPAIPSLSKSGSEAYFRACLGRLQLARRLDSEDRPVIAVHPGVIASNFAGVPAVLKPIMNCMFITPEAGAQANLYAAICDTSEFPAVGKRYFHNKWSWINLKKSDKSSNEQQTTELLEACHNLFETSSNNE